MNKKTRGHWDKSAFYPCVSEYRPEELTLTITLNREGLETIPVKQPDEKPIKTYFEKSKLE